MRKRGFEFVDEKFKKNDTGAKLPVRSTSRSAGYDLFIPKKVVIPANNRSPIIPLDIKAYMQPNEVLMIYIRSSVGIKKGLVLSNGTGIIDADYYSNPDNDGNIGISLLNTTNEDIIVEAGERIAQGIFLGYLVADDDKTTTERVGGFGSTN